MQKSGTPQHWSHSKIFEDVGVAIDNGVTPSEFWEQWDSRDQAFAIARARAIRTMEAWEHHLHEKEVRRQRSRKPA